VIAEEIRRAEDDVARDVRTTAPHIAGGWVGGVGRESEEGGRHSKIRRPLRTFIGKSTRIAHLGDVLEERRGRRHGVESERRTKGRE